MALDLPGVATSVTYGFQGKTGAGTLTYGGASAGTLLILDEIMGALPNPQTITAS